jgi:hypothetical protein
MAIRLTIIDLGALRGTGHAWIRNIRALKQAEWAGPTNQAPNQLKQRRS